VIDNSTVLARDLAQLSHLRFLRHLAGLEA